MGTTSINDTVQELTETVLIGLSDPTGFSELGPPDSTTLNIWSEDWDEIPTLSQLGKALILLVLLVSGYLVVRRRRIHTH